MLRGVCRQSCGNRKDRIQNADEGRKQMIQKGLYKKVHNNRRATKLNTATLEVTKETQRDRKRQDVASTANRPRTKEEE